MQLSIIIPTLNEEENIEKLIHFLKTHSNNFVTDIIVSDGGSSDRTLVVAKDAGAAAVLSPGSGRASQMNYGASLAKGDVLYFVHADCFPPVTYTTDINNALLKGYDLGRYRTRFNNDRNILKLNAWFTRFDMFICMGGDQTLFIKKQLFNDCGGYNNTMRIMEDYEFCKRARQKGKYSILDGAALISARKYDNNSWLSVQLANAKIVSMYKKGAAQQDMIDKYKSLLDYR